MFSDFGCRQLWQHGISCVTRVNFSQAVHLLAMFASIKPLASCLPHSSPPLGPSAGSACVWECSLMTPYGASMVTIAHVGKRRVISWGQPRLSSQGSGVPALPNFGVLLYLCLHPLTQNDQIRHGNTYDNEECFRSATPLRLHECVSRFVSDSRVSCLTWSYP